MVKTVGQIAYDAYFLCAGGRSLASGQTLPAWGQMPEPIRDAWEAAANAVVEHFRFALVESETVFLPRLTDAIEDAVAVAQWAIGLSRHMLDPESVALRETVLRQSLSVAILDSSAKRLSVRLFPTEQDAFDAFAYVVCDSGEGGENPDGRFFLYDDEEFSGDAHQLFEHYQKGGFWIGSVGVC